MFTYEQAKQMIDKISQVPYPILSRIYPNKNYANMLKNDFAGDLGEISAIMQYIYEHIEYSEKQDLSKTLKMIAIEEMKHLNAIGEIIKKLGEKPCYEGSRGNFWSSKNVKYEFKTIEDMIRYNIYTEEMAIQGYRRAMMYTKNLSIRKVLERIILDEKTHKQIFENILKNKMA